MLSALLLLLLSGPLPGAAEVNPTLTPSSWLLEGDDLARRVLHAPSPGPTRPKDSVWIEYQRDPRFRGERSTEARAFEMLLRTQLGPAGASDWQTSLRKSMERDPIRVFITWQPLGIRAINRLNSGRIYPVGLITRPAKVDGYAYDPPQFLEHDLVHAHLTETYLRLNAFTASLNVKARKRVTRFYREFDYTCVVATMDARTHLLFDLGYFLYFHELEFSHLWNHEFALLLANPNSGATDLRRAYEKFELRLKVEFNSAEAVVTLNTSAKRLVARFIDRGDLYVNLPRETKCALALDPDPGPVVREVIEAALSVFFTEHYRHALAYMSEAPKPQNK